MRKPTHRRTRTNWLALLISVSSVSGIALALLGYGVAIAVQAKFGIPHSMTFSSSLELFNLGCWAIAQILMDSQDLSAVWKAIGEIWAVAWPITSTAIGLVTCTGIVLWSTFVAGKKLKPWVLKVIDQGTAGEGVMSFLRHHPVIAKLVAFFIVSFGVFVGTPLLMVVGLIALVFLCAFLTLIPGVGVTVGQTFIDNWVIRPTVCVQPSSRETRMARASKPPLSKESKTYAANCIAIIRAKEELDRGRVIFATPNAVLLYDPLTGDVRRVSTDGVTVKVVGEL